MPPTTRRIDDSETERAFALLQDVATWIRAQGRRQRIAATSMDTYLRWQRCGGNWGVFDDADLVAIFTVVREPLTDWPDAAIEGPVLWLRALAVDPDRRGASLGALAVRAALELTTPNEYLYLDCVSGFLPRYYAGHGFDLLAQQVRTYPDGAYDITLMRQRGNAAPS